VGQKVKGTPLPWVPVPCPVRVALWTPVPKPVLCWMPRRANELNGVKSVLDDVRWSALGVG